MKFNITNPRELFSMGIYGILDNEKKIIYIGKTERCFLFRINEHVKKIDKLKTKERVELTLGDNSEFVILKEINADTSTRNILLYEKEFMDSYIDKGFNVISKHSFKISYDRRYRSRITDISFNEKLRKGFVELFDDMMITFSLESKIPIDRCYARAYYLINNRFGINKGIEESLSIKELEYICSEIFFKYLDTLINKKNKLLKHKKDKMKKVDFV